MSGRGNGPFSPRLVLVLVLLGMALFVVALWAIGNNAGQRQPPATEAHAEGRGLIGYAALSDYLKKRGYAVENVQNPGQLKKGGVLVLTPPHRIDTKELGRVVDAHRQLGPTIVILPKWFAVGAPIKAKDPKDGTVRLLNARPPDWKGWHDEVSLDLYPMKDGPNPGGWDGMGLKGTMPAPDLVMSGQGQGLVPLIEDEFTGRILAAYVADGGDYPQLREASLAQEEPGDEQSEIKQYPLIMVFDPDLLDNYGFARIESAQLADRLITAALDGAPKQVFFDLTLDGYVKQRNLLEQAFKPPFAAATICLLLAALVALWRAFHRFGPPLLAIRSIAFGKRALVANAAGLIQRARRLHLLGPPYADAARERLVRALALPGRLDPSAAEAAIDRALAARAPGTIPFSAAAAQLRTARRPADLLRAARLIHSLERTLVR